MSTRLLGQRGLNSERADAANERDQPPDSRSLSPGPSEAELVRLWEGQRFPSQALVSGDGWPLRVVFRGRPCSGGAGPDFRDAVIELGGRQLRGDVELHVLASAFRRHGHHRDHAYDNVILHVVFWDDDGENTCLASGRRVPVVALGPWVARRAEELQAWLSRPALWQEPCCSAKQRLGAEAVAAILDEAGDCRFQGKAATFAAALAEEDGEETLYRGILEALGYSQNREPFRLLARALPWRQFGRCIGARPLQERVLAAEGALLSRAGFLGPLAGDLGALPSWAAHGSGVESSALPWRLTGMRPENHPSRRLAGAARLLVRYLGKGLLAGLLEKVAEASVEGPQTLTTALRVDDGLIGPGRADEIAVNVVLPFTLAWAQARQDKPLAQAALTLYQRYPKLAPYGILRRLTAALGRELIAGARRQQGMLHLFHRYCRQGGCNRCPLA
ncbi:MAG: hypothetical protein AMJ38_04800 [Dehalococcoidia bacterium DG_22]|nr:MAG: hypothetical protein AMJ38_04800 [Dehalococcoidia bacterium DG_22]